MGACPIIAEVPELPAPAVPEVAPPAAPDVAPPAVELDPLLPAPPVVELDPLLPLDPDPEPMLALVSIHCAELEPPALALPPAPAVPVVPVAPALLCPPRCRQPVTVICRLPELPDD